MEKKQLLLSLTIHLCPLGKKVRSSTMPKKTHLAKIFFRQINLAKKLLYERHLSGTNKLLAAKTTVMQNYKLHKSSIHYISSPSTPGSQRLNQVTSVPKTHRGTVQLPPPLTSLPPNQIRSRVHPE